MTQEKKNGKIIAIITMIFLFGMISFVTNLAAPMGIVLKNQFDVSNALGMLGNFGNFIAYAVMGLVSTGATLEANGLREVEVIYRSKACLIQRDGEMEESKQQLIDKLLTRIQGVIQARESKYIMMHAPTERLDEVIALLPGAERPTILPLAGDQQRVAMHMVSSETLFWETMEKLKALGASSILVLPIEKMME